MVYQTDQSSCAEGLTAAEKGGDGSGSNIYLSQITAAYWGLGSGQWAVEAAGVRWRLVEGIVVEGGGGKWDGTGTGCGCGLVMQGCSMWCSQL